MEKKVKRAFFLIALIILSLLTFAVSYADKNNNDEVSAVYRDYFKTKGVDYNEAVAKFGDDNAAVAAFTAVQARVKIGDVYVSYKNYGGDWNRVMRRYRVAQSALFLPVPAQYRVGPPYGKAYGYWAKHKKHPSSRITLSTGDYRNLVDLNIANKYLNISVTQVMDERGKGYTFREMVRNHHRKQKGHSEFYNENNGGCGGECHGNCGSQKHNNGNCDGSCNKNGKGHGHGNGNGNGNGKGKGKGKDQNE